MFYVCVSIDRRCWGRIWKTALEMHWCYYYNCRRSRRRSRRRSSSTTQWKAHLKNPLQNCILHSAAALIFHTKSFEALSHSIQRSLAAPATAGRGVENFQFLEMHLKANCQVSSFSSEKTFSSICNERDWSSSAILEFTVGKNFEKKSIFIL